MSEQIAIEKDDIVQIVPSHKWGGCLAVVTEPKNFGCQAYITIPGVTGQAYIRLRWGEFEAVGAKAIFVPEGEQNEGDVLQTSSDGAGIQSG